jgi:hypothetical protein
MDSHTVSESVPRATISTTSPTTSEQIMELWEKAVAEYEANTQLSIPEREMIKAKTLKEIIDLPKQGWNRTMNERQRRFHERAQRTVSQVLSVFDLIEGLLGLAETVISNSRIANLSGLSSSPNHFRCGQGLSSGRPILAICNFLERKKFVGRLRPYRQAVFGHTGLLCPDQFES